MPKVDRVGVVKVSADGWELLPVHATEAEHMSFVHALFVHRFAKTKVDALIGPALPTPPVTNASLPVPE